MFRNLIAAFFLFALALPAFAMPVPVQAEQAMASDCHGMPIKHGKGNTPDLGGSMKQHGCIGCIAPYAPKIAVVPIADLPFITIAQSIRELDGTIPPPSLPPPRG